MCTSSKNSLSFKFQYDNTLRKNIAEKEKIDITDLNSNMIIL